MAKDVAHKCSDRGKDGGIFIGSVLIVGVFYHEAKGARVVVIIGRIRGKTLRGGEGSQQDDGDEGEREFHGGGKEAGGLVGRYMESRKVARSEW